MPRRREVLRLIATVGGTGLFTTGISGAEGKTVDERTDENRNTEATTGVTGATTAASTRSRKIVPSDGASDEKFGSAVAVENDTALIGASEDDGSGSAFVYTRSGESWTRQDKLTPDDGNISDFFGSAVALAGSTALVGAPFDDNDNGTKAGAAYVYERDDGTWSRQDKLTAEDGDGEDQLGEAVALEGDTALVGAFNDEDPNGRNGGAAYVFTRTDGSWSQQDKLAPEDGNTEDEFGDAVALTGDTALVGAPEDEAVGTSAGSAYVFERDGGTWTERTKLTAEDGNFRDRFGRALAVSGDTAFIGAPTDGDANGNEAGSVYVFTRTDGDWTQADKLAPADGDRGDQFGSAVALAGPTALVGARRDEDPNGVAAGAAYVFERSGGSWVERAKLAPGDGDRRDQFGRAVALGCGTALFGVPFDDNENGRSAGSAYVFTGYTDRAVVARYANESGRVGTRGLRAAVADWSSGDLPTDLLRAVVGAWSTGEPVC